MTAPNDDFLPVSHVSEFLANGSQAEKITLPHGVILVTATAFTTPRPQAFAHGGWYSYKPIMWLSGAPGQWRATFTVASKGVTQAYIHIADALTGSDVGSPITITHQKIG